MAKKKIVAEVAAEEEVMEEVKEEVKNEEKPEVVLSKESICEFYGIRDDEILSPERDLSKYGLKKQEEEALLDWAAKNAEVKAGDVVFDMYLCSPEERAILEKYGISPKDVAENNMDELSDEEKDIMVAYYNRLVAKL